MKLYDSHCHLNSKEMIGWYEEYIKDFVAGGGAGIVNAWCDEFCNEKGIEIAKTSQPSSEDGFIIKSTVWLHPWIVDDEITNENLDEEIKKLKTMIVENRDEVVAVGECGIDLHFSSPLTPLLQRREHLSLQKKLFSAQCELARELDLPLVVHSRDAFVQTFDILKEYQDLVVYFHCRWYGVAELNELKNFKFKKLYIGFCGNVTYKNAENLRESLKVVDLDSLVLETDSPYLAPQVVRWEMNNPSNVKHIYEFVSEYLSLDIKKLAQQCERNFKNLYNV